ncbi:MAG: S9 family peptidase [Blastocatellia bacterium]|nr:S9 family peptidase [Blastocatellia bacterium]MCS7157233.1 S9 family peptidase [Blastocatellia bacterium]MDW8167185.1 prolyl oligopeptidase family serine peptidase [Acidobacteriota bacterium]MDW8256509.1 prolyl oligopeptidase family serine peptidase [Acidobacteriota bacterium]
MRRFHQWLGIFVAITCLLSAVSPLVCAQGTRADYERAFALRERLEGLALNIVDNVEWIENTPRFWYRRTVKGGHEFVLVDAETLAKRPAFDHARLAASLSAAMGRNYTSTTLPFSTLTFVDQERAIQFTAAGATWRCDLTDYACRQIGPAAPGFSRGRGPEEAEEYPREYDNDVQDGMVFLPTREPSPQQEQQTRRPPPFSPIQSSQELQVKPSPDGRWEAFIRNYNVFIRPKGKEEAIPLSYDGSEADAYTFASITWSPDSRRLVAYRVRQGYRRQVHYIESSPTDQLQPKLHTREYAKPGDVLDVAQPVLFDVEARKAIAIENSLFPNPYSLSNPVWWKDGRAFTFEYNQRGHQVYRVIEVDAATGLPRVLINEECATFFSYRPLSPNHRETGTRYRYDIADGREIIWASERDGWRHLYLYDGLTGKVRNQITRGPWVVRGVVKVDEERRQIWFQASGMYRDQDPYFIHYYRINFDGSGLVALTEANGDHLVRFSSDMKYYVDLWSRVDHPPVLELRRTEDRKILMEVERGDISELLAIGWRPPEVFVAKGRDGKTDIWGIIIRPMNFDPSKRYPVIENIYAGPQGSFVPKSFSVYNPMRSLAELGFIVVQIDGMGTANRSKAFHDVAWKNLRDAGFPDRILWHKAVAAKYSYYDITRVGIYGHSAGGQNALAALLFHPDFYKVAVSSCGCHDNRMDKIWWNEQWMGWPVGPHYVESSNVENAHRLRGKVLLIVGELDTNVDPSSTMQVVNALIKANKTFDLLVLPGQGHTMGGAYGTRKMYDFFVHHLLGVEPPDWNALSEEMPQQ